MKYLFEKAVAAVFCVILFAVPILTKIEPHVEYSIFENRNMASAPDFTVSELFNGQYLALWDNYFSDHIWKRDAYITAYTYLNINILKKVVVNDIVVQDDVLLPFREYTADKFDFTEQAAYMAERLSLLNSLVESYGGEFIYVGVPGQISIFRDYYPRYLNNDDIKLTLTENEFFPQLEKNNIKYINMREKFLQLDDYIQYYSTIDHHFNIFGAFVTYQTVINKIKNDFDSSIPILTEDDVEFVVIENPFYGSRNRKLYGLYKSDERMYYYILKEQISFTRFNNGVYVPSSVFGLPEDTVTPVTYDGIYMNGDIGETIILTDREYLPNALIFGDSYTNAVETFLYASFNQTVSLDLRLYKEKTILEYIDEYKPDYVFCLRDDSVYLVTSGNGEIK